MHTLNCGPEMVVYKDSVVFRNCPNRYFERTLFDIFFAQILIFE